MINRISTQDPRTSYFRVAGFLLCAVLPIVAGWGLLRSLTVLVLDNETYSHIPLIPILSLFLVYAERETIFSTPSRGWKAGGVLILAGGTLFVLASLGFAGAGSANSLSIFMLGLGLFWAGIFALFFGSSALRAAKFQFLFLLFMVPIPGPILSATIFLLQKTSAYVAGVLFRLFAIPVLQQGFDFTLPGITIRVAEECSGIRSTLALLITAVVASHIALRTTWRKICFCLLVFPIGVFKNGVRIVTLSALAVYVNPSFLHGPLHKKGGILFFVLGLALLASALVLIKRSEAPNKNSARRAGRDVGLRDAQSNRISQGLHDTGQR